MDRSRRVDKDRQAKEAEFNHLKQIRSDVLDVASFYRVKAAFDRAKWGMAAGAVAAAIGITAFAWGANQPKTTTINAGDVLPKSPSNVTVVLRKKGIERYGARLRKNKNCNLSNLPAVAFAVSHTTYEVVTIATKNCRIRRMTITAAQGQVIPRVKNH